MKYYCGICLLMSGVLYGQASTPPSNSEVSVDQKLMDKIYTQTLTQDKAEESGRTSEFAMSAGEMLLSQLELRSSYYSLDYADQVAGIPFVKLQYARLVDLGEKWRGEIYGLVGYANSQGIYHVQGANGIELRDNINLDWVPVEMGVTALYPVAFMTTSFGFIGGAGLDWLSQSGSLDGVSQTYWLTHYNAGAAARVKFGSNASLSGVQLSVTRQQQLGKQQKLAGVNISLGVHFAM